MPNTRLERISELSLYETKRPRNNFGHKTVKPEVLDMTAKMLADQCMTKKTCIPLPMTSSIKRGHQVVNVLAE